MCPHFFVDNPDAMDAFKKDGVANLKDLRVEMMLEFVHHELVPKLIVKRDGCLFNDEGGDAVGVLADVVTPTHMSRAWACQRNKCQNASQRCRKGRKLT